MYKEVTINDIARILSDYTVKVIHGDRFAYENAVHELKTKYELNEAQEAMIRNTLYHTSIILCTKPDVQILAHALEVGSTIILWTLADDWHCINNRTLGDRDDYITQTKNETL